MTQFPLPTTQKELRGWMGLCNQLNHYVQGLAGEQAEFRKLLKKNVNFTVTEKMVKEFEAAKEAMGKNILLNAFEGCKGDFSHHGRVSGWFWSHINAKEK